MKDSGSKIFFLPCPKCLIAQKVEGSGSRLRFAPASILLYADEIERLIERFKWKGEWGTAQHRGSVRAYFQSILGSNLPTNG